MIDQIEIIANKIDEEFYLISREVIKLLLELPSWKCERCNTINFILNKRCIYCWTKEGLTIPRR